MLKNIRKEFLILFLITFFLQSAFAVNIEQIDKKRETAQRNIYHLKLLERIETNKLYKNQQKLEDTEQKLEYNKEKYGATKDELSDLRKKLSELTSDYENQISYSNRRITQIYKTQRKSYVEFLLSSHDLNSFLDRIYFENIVMKIDKERIRSTQIRTRRIMNLKERIEFQERSLASDIKVMDRQQRNIQDAIDRNQKYIEKLQTDRATWERAERELAKQSEQLTKLINKSTRDDGNAILVTGGFLRPVSGRITSNYGWRTHPIFKRRIFHSGIDLGSPMGTPIRAANDGRVIFAGWYGGYGKVVILDHGRVNGAPTTTLYAHMSAINASVGQSVRRGQTIGRVGSTGYSTGPHLHFEVRVNGKTSNPLNYVPR
jgi:murein DD-endopeptidase MepM/ murein hydrolase activator NlpD